VPMVRELGWPSYSVVNWFGLLAPARTPSATIQTLHGALQAGLATPEMQSRLTTAGVEPQSLTPSEMAAFIKNEVSRWGRVVKSANITLN
jgi:tripartite-type tricarboxylate transporter receptor subunit TctC